MLKNNKAITLIALVITIVVILILAVITLNIAIGNNGIIKRAKDAALMNKKAQYIEEIQMEIVDENLERLQKPKEELFIVSLQKRLQGTQTASQENVKVYTKKAWINKAEINLRTLLVVYTVDDYEILIDVDNGNNTATIRDSLIKKGRECTITFNGNSAIGGSTNSKTTSEGLYIELPENGFTKTNYTFAGWYKNPECDGDRYNPSEAYQVLNDETLYAKWSQSAITITYNPGFETEDTMSNTTIEVGATDNLLDNAFSRLGYTFAGWKDQYDDTYIYENHQEITAEKDLTLTAQWTPTEYQISYDLDGGALESGKTNPTTYTIESSEITLNNPIKSGNAFTGWTEGNETTPQTVVTIATGSTGAKSYKANWRLNSIQQLYGYTSSSTIPWNTFKDILDKDIYDDSVVGAQVTDSNGHNWRIIRVGADYYDLWYQTSIGSMAFSTSYDINSTTYSNCTLRTAINGSSFYTKTSLLPTSLKTYVIQKSGYAGGATNSRWGTRAEYNDYVWLLTYNELGCTGSTDSYDYSYIPNNTDGSLCPYFASKPSLPYSTMQSPHSYYQGWDNSIRALVVTNGYKIDPYCSSTSSYAVVPAVRVQ